MLILGTAILVAWDARVSHLRCSGALLFSFPALTGRANLCRASGAGFAGCVKIWRAGLLGGVGGTATARKPPRGYSVAGGRQTEDSANLAITLVPPSGLVRISKWPPSWRTRSRMPCRPTPERSGEPGREGRPLPQSRT